MISTLLVHSRSPCEECNQYIIGLFENAELFQLFNFEDCSVDEFSCACRAFLLGFKTFRKFSVDEKLGDDLRIGVSKRWHSLLRLMAEDDRAPQDFVQEVPLLPLD